MTLEEFTEGSLVGKMQLRRDLLNGKVGRRKHVACLTVNQLADKSIHRLARLAPDNGSKILRAHVQGIGIVRHLMFLFIMIHQ